MNTIDDKAFKIFKNTKINQAQMLLKYQENIYDDGTFYNAPKLSYQLFITCVYAKDINMFITTSFSLLADKQQKQSTYEKLFKEQE